MEQHVYLYSVVELVLGQSQYNVVEEQHVYLWIVARVEQHVYLWIVVRVEQHVYLWIEWSNMSTCTLLYQ